MAVDGTTPKRFYYTCPSTASSINAVSALIERLNIIIVDASITPVKFAGLSALTNGLLVDIEDDNSTVVFDFLAGETIKRNIEFGWLAGGDVVGQNYGASDALPIRWTLSKAGGESFKLKPGYSIGITIQDNLSGMPTNGFTAMVQGKLV